MALVNNESKFKKNKMRMKEETRLKYITEVEKYITRRWYKRALSVAGKYPLKKDFIICQTRALDEYIVSKKNLLKVPHIVKENPRFRYAHPMKIYLVAELDKKFPKRENPYRPEGVRTRSVMKHVPIIKNCK